MTCKCGYRFAEEALAALEGKRSQEYESYLVVNDRDYRTFLKKEVAARQARGLARTKALLRSARYAGQLLECPQCSRYLLIKPKTFELAVLARED